MSGESYPNNTEGGPFEVANKTRNAGTVGGKFSGGRMR